MVLGALTKEKARRQGFLEGWAKTHGKSPASPEAYEALSKWLEQRALAEGYGMPSSARARIEGKAETNKAWREWLKRKTEAESKGQLFNEPAPDSA